jgi:tetratricopeptide (TPR) repeat protein
MHESQLVDRYVDENMQAEASIENGNDSDAARILLAIIDKDPENARAYNNMGILSWKRKSWNDAFTMFNKAVSITPDFQDALINLFDAALKLKKIKEIESLFEKAVTINPTLDDTKTIYDSIKTLGDEIYKTKRALSIGFYSPYIETAEKELENGNFTGAMQNFIKANDIEGPNSSSYCGLGIISYYQGRYDDAYKLFIESIKLNPSDPDTFLNLFDAAKETGNLITARDIFNIYRKDFPSIESVAEIFDTIN